MNFPQHEAALALVLSGLSIFVWSILLGRCLAHRMHHKERRGGTSVMYLVGVIVSVGFFASAFGFAQNTDLVEPDLISPTVLTFVASIARGALFMGGLLLLVANRDHEPKEGE